MERVPTVSGTTNLVDILDRVLDKGLVVAGDIRISLANVELLTIRIRLLVCSVDKAEQIGLNWWKHDPNLTMGQTVPQTRPLPGPPPSSGITGTTTFNRRVTTVKKRKVKTKR
jgi:hypothetical protein